MEIFKKLKYLIKNIKKRLSFLLEVFKIKRLSKYLNSKYRYVMERYINADVPSDFSGEEYTVWVMWWQGEEQMPDVVKICYSSLKKYANGHQINLITKDNYKKYVEIPKFVLDKVDQQTITLTHFSDILRVCLLSEYGGLWIDSTVLLTNNLPKKINTCYWTPRWKLMPKDYNIYKLWIGLWAISSVSKLTIQQCIPVWYSCKRNPLFLCLKDFWFDYCRKENTIPYYWITEVFLIGSMYDKIPMVKQITDNVPFNNELMFKDGLDSIANKPYKRNIISDICANTQFHKFSYKSTFFEKDQETGEETLYGFLKRNGTDFH